MQVLVRLGHSLDMFHYVDIVKDHCSHYGVVFLSIIIPDFNCNRLAAAEAENLTLKARSGQVDDLERQCRNLREDIAVMTGRRDVLRYSSPPPKSYATVDLSW